VLGDGHGVDAAVVEGLRDPLPRLDALLAAGSRDGDPDPDPDEDAFAAAPGEWAWHAHALDVDDLLPNDVLSLWVAPDSPEDLARQDAARLVARDFALGLADAHHAQLPPNAACLDAALLALPFHDSAPLHAFAGARA